MDKIIVKWKFVLLIKNITRVLKLIIVVSSVKKINRLMAEYDLTETLSPYFDRHLILSLLEFICGKYI